MRFEFKQAVCLDKKDYARGVHELPESVIESLSQNETFLKYCELGLIEKTDKGNAISSDLLLEHKKKLAEQCLALNATKKVEAESVKSKDEVAEEVKEPVAKGKSKKNKG